MRKLICGVLIAVALLLGSAALGEARGRRPHVGFHVLVGPGLWLGSHAFWGPHWWGHPYPYVGPPVVIRQQAPIYVEPPLPVPEPYYWYYCRETQTYYPYVQQCPSDWMKVVPPAAPPGP